MLPFDLCGFLSAGVEISFLLVGPESETHFGTEIISRQKHKYEASIERNTESKRVERRKVFLPDSDRQCPLPRRSNCSSCLNADTWDWEVHEMFRVCKIVLNLNFVGI